MKRSSLMAATMMLSAACTTAPGEIEDPSDDDLVTDEGATGHVWVETPEGRRRLGYIVEDGHAIHEGDIDLGPAEELLHRGGAANLGQRWPLGHVPWAFHPMFDPTDQVCMPNGLPPCVAATDVIHDVLDELEAQLPIDFEEVPYADLLSYPNHILIEWGTFGASYAGVSDSCGMAGGEQTLKFRRGDIDNLTEAYNLQPTPDVARHEMLHALGLWHEQSRADRATAVIVDYSCIIDDKEIQYEIQPESADVGPYDYESIMHYGEDDACVPWMGGCLCPTMVAIPSGPSSFGGATLTVDDVNTLWEMYTQLLDLNEPNDKFGAALAVGDFDADGYDDVAIGMPMESVGLLTRAGAVIVYKGTADGPVMWKRLTELDVPGHGPGGSEFFGTAVAAGDFDADGFDDLAVGAPNDQSTSGAGAVFVFRGTQATGLVASTVLTQETGLAGTSEPGDKFGQSLAMGPLTDVAAAGGIRFDSLAVGAPLDRVLSVTGGTMIPAGAVYIYTMTPATAGGPPGGPAKPTRLTRQGAAPAPNDEYGSALAIGILDSTPSDPRPDLAVGGAGGNFVDLYRGVLPVGIPSAWGSVAAYVGSRTGFPGERFGAALAIGPFAADRPYVAVGAPGTSTTAGRVVLYAGFSAIATSIVDSTPVANDQFGAAVAFGRLQGATLGDLAIGVPGKNGTRGKIRILLDGQFTAFTDRDQPSLTSPAVFDADPKDLFGSSLAFGHFDGTQRPTTAHTGTRRLDLAVGAPGERPDRPHNTEDDAGGAVYTLMGAGSGTPVGWHQLEQEFTNVLYE